MKVLVIPDVHLKPWMFEQAGSAYACKTGGPCSVSDGYSG